MAVHNDTSDIWMVKEDDHGTCIIVCLLGVVTIASFGAGLSLAASGMTLATAIATDLGILGGTAGLSKVLVDAFETKGFTKLSPGKTYKSRKHSLSLLREVQIAGWEDNRPGWYKYGCFDAFSGATDGSTKTYKISNWAREVQYKQIK